MQNRKIAFVHYPYVANSARLETMPFALNAVTTLATAGWEVDVYLWEQPSPAYDSLLPSHITLQYFTEPLPSLLNRLRPLWLRLQFRWRKNYYCIFGLGQIGIYIAALMARASQCPFIYFNDEFPSFWGTNRWAKLEQWAVREAAMVIVPDQQRFHPLCHELPSIASKPHAVLPNVPAIHPSFEKMNWHEKLGLPVGSVPFLHAGTIADWAQVPELLASVPYWPKEAVLVLHSRSQNEATSMRQQLAHLEVPHKVFWSSQPLSVNELHSLVSYCTGNFALYRNLGPNLAYVGFSSGKLMRSLVCGTPVIASRLPSLAFITEYRLGVLVTHPVEIPEAIKQILQERADYRSRCLSFCDTHASFEKHWDTFCKQLRQTAQIDLHRPVA